MISGEKEFARFAKRVAWRDTLFASHELETFLIAAITRYFYHRTTQEFVLLLAKAIFDDKSSLLDPDTLEFVSLLAALSDLRLEKYSTGYINRIFIKFLQTRVPSIVVNLETSARTQ